MLSIKEATLADVSSLALLTEQLGYPLPVSAVEANVRAYLQDADRALLVAVWGEHIVGYIALDMAQTFHREGKHMRVVSLVVDQLHRGKGIGKRLLQEAESRAKRHGCWVIEITSSMRRAKDGTHAFYLHQGYAQSDQVYFRKLIDKKSL